MIKWSNNAQFGAVPDSWDETDATKNAGENVPGDASSAWRDALPLGNALFLYNDSQVFRMVETGTNDIFAFTRKFNNRGIINTNCVVEVAGRHYVFDSTDIYTHDGVQAVSICEGTVKDYIFGGMDLSAKNRFFVFYNPLQNTVHFCYRSADDLVSFVNSEKCNRAAVYDLTNQTWSFDDLPNVVGSCYANIDNILTYEDVLTSYEETGGTYAGQETGDFQFMFLCGLENTADGLENVLYGYDPVQGGQMPFALDETATMPAKVYRVGLDLDEDGQDIRTTKVIRGIYPQIEDFERDGVTLKFAGTQYNDQEPSWTDPVAFDPSEQTKTNPMVNGRYLAWYLECGFEDDFRFSGFDADIVSTAHRG